MLTSLSLSKSYSTLWHQHLHVHSFDPLGADSHGFVRTFLLFNHRERILQTRNKVRKFVFLQARSSHANVETDEQLREAPEKSPKFRFDDVDVPKEPSCNGTKLHEDADHENGGKLSENSSEGSIQETEDRGEGSFVSTIEFRNQIDNKLDEIASTSSPEGSLSKEAAMGGSLLAIFGIISLIGGLGYFGYHFKDQINEFLMSFESRIDEFGPFGYPLFILGYAGLEVLAVPAIPITMSAGLIFGPITGTLLCSVSGTMAAVIAFLIARYVARDRILKLIEGNKRFNAIDKAIGKDSFRIVTMLRLSPLLPFSVGNYIYGLTSVELLPYALGSWIGMLPGTWAYVSAGAFGRSLIQADEGGLFSGDSHVWYLALGIFVTLGTGAYVTNVAKKAMKDLDDE